LNHSASRYWFRDVNAIAGLCAASSAIRFCFVETLSGFNAPSVFLKSDSVPRCSASLDRVRASHVPRRPQYYQSTTTSCAGYGSAYLFASPLQPILSQFAPMRRRAPQGLVPLKPGTIGYRSAGRTQELPGSWRIHPIPLPRSRIPASSSGLALSPKRCSSHLVENESTDISEISGLNHAASVPTAYASSSALPHRLQGSLPA